MFIGRERELKALEKFKKEASYGETASCRNFAIIIIAHIIHFLYAESWCLFE